MVRQILTNENNVVTAVSEGGFIDGGISVSEFPSDIYADVKKYCYIEGVFIPRENYSPEPPPLCENDIQAEINLENDFRLSCLELGI